MDLKLMVVLENRTSVQYQLITLYQIYFIFQNRGPPRSQIWVFGMVAVSHIPAIGYMQTIPQWDARTLLPIIQQHVRPGTIVRLHGTFKPVQDPD